MRCYILLALALAVAAIVSVDASNPKEDLGEGPGGKKVGKKVSKKPSTRHGTTRSKPTTGTPAPEESIKLSKKPSSRHKRKDTDVPGAPEGPRSPRSHRTHGAKVPGTGSVTEPGSAGASTSTQVSPHGYSGQMIAVTADAAEGEEEPYSVEIPLERAQVSITWRNVMEDAGGDNPTAQALQSRSSRQALDMYLAINKMLYEGHPSLYNNKMTERKGSGVGETSKGVSDKDKPTGEQAKGLSEADKDAAAETTSAYFPNLVQLVDAIASDPTLAMCSKTEQAADEKTVCALNKLHQDIYDQSRKGELIPLMDLKSFEPEEIAKGLVHRAQLVDLIMLADYLNDPLVLSISLKLIADDTTDTPVPKGDIRIEGEAAKSYDPESDPKRRVPSVIRRMWAIQMDLTADELDQIAKDYGITEEVTEAGKAYRYYTRPCDLPGGKCATAGAVGAPAKEPEETPDPLALGPGVKSKSKKRGTKKVKPSDDVPGGPGKVRKAATSTRKRKGDDPKEKKKKPQDPVTGKKS